MNSNYVPHTLFDRHIEMPNCAPSKSVLKIWKRKILCKKPEVIRYLYMKHNRFKYRIARMVQWLQVSRSFYYAWRRRTPSTRQLEDEALLEQIRQIHAASRGAYGSKKITNEINRKLDR